MKKRLHSIAATKGARAALLGVFAALTGLAGLFSLPPLDRDEARFAQATAQMLEEGDFVSIRFQDQERNKKPAGIHWLQAAIVAALSAPDAREIWAYRLPSLAATIAAVVATFLAGARLFGARTGMLAALFLAAAPLVAVEAMIAKTDAALLAAVAVAQAALLSVYASVAEGRRADLRAALLFWTATGAGLLIKGPVAPMISLLTIAALCVADRSRRLVAALRPGFGLLILLALIAPWAILIAGATEGRFFAEAVGRDLLGKLGVAQEGHGGPPGYHLVLSPLLFWPAAALLIPAAQDAVAARGDWRVRFLLAWIVPAFVVFELTATKLPHYTLPLYPAIAILCARTALAIPEGGRMARRAGAAIYALAGLAFGGAIVFAVLNFAPEPVAPAAAAAGALIALAGCGVAALFWRGAAKRGAAAAVLLSALALVVLKEGILPRLDALAVSPRLSAALEEAARHPLRDAAPPVALAGFYEPSAVFLLGTKTALGDGANAARHLARHARAAAIVEAGEQQAFDAAAAALGLSPLSIAAVEGFNYSKGRKVRLQIFILEPQ